MGFVARDFTTPNEYTGFAINSRNGNDLASSNLRRRFLPFAGVCRLAPYFPDHRVAVDQMDSQKIDFAIRVDVDDLNMPPALVITGNHE